MKTMHSKARQLEITAFLYSLSKGLRAIYHSEKIPRSRIRGVGSSSQVIRRGAILLFLIKYSRAQRGKKDFSPHHLSLCYSRAKRLFE